MRIIIFTGKGGVGKTSISASTAVEAAKHGYNTLIASTDPAHSLSDVFATRIGDKCVRLSKNLYALEINVFEELKNNWQIMREHFTGLFKFFGYEDDVIAEEVSFLPGVEEIFSLATIMKYREKGGFDTIIIDCAPTANTMRLLTFSESTSARILKYVNLEKKFVKVARPIAKITKVYPSELLPNDAYYDSFECLMTNLAKLREILIDSKVTSVRLVVNPEKIVIAETKRAFTYFNLFEFSVDAIILNKILPQEVEGGYFDKWKKIQGKYITQLKDSFLNTPIFHARYYEEELVGMDLLAKMGEDIYQSKNPITIFHKGQHFQIKKKEGQIAMTIPLPFSNISDLDVLQSDGELIINVGMIRRVLSLPDILIGKKLNKAKFKDNLLTIEFME